MKKKENHEKKRSRATDKQENKTNKNKMTGIMGEKTEISGKHQTIRENEKKGIKGKEGKG